MPILEEGGSICDPKDSARCREMCSVGAGGHQRSAGSRMGTAVRPQQRESRVMPREYDPAAAE